MTVADFRAPAPEDCTTQVAFDLDHARFWALVVDALERIGRWSSRLADASPGQRAAGVTDVDRRAPIALGALERLERTLEARRLVVPRE